MNADHKPSSDPAALARAIVDANLYLVLATADRTGRPWSTPVYFAHEQYAEFLWVSAPDATHSLIIVTRPQIGIVIFDSHAPISTGQGVYISATAEPVTGHDLVPGIETFSRRAVGHGGAAWRADDVQNQAACGSTVPRPRRTRSSPRTVNPTIGFPYGPPDRHIRGHREPMPGGSQGAPRRHGATMPSAH